MTAPVAAPQDRFGLFDSLRAIAALSVVAYHAGFYIRGLAGPLGRTATQHDAGFPALGVVVFFVISGFLLYRPFAQARLSGAPMPRLVPYAVRRALRIVPAYWLALPVVVAVVGVPGVFDGAGIATYFGFAQVYDVRTLAGGIAQAWTLDVEITFYAGLALLALAMRRWVVGSQRGFLASELATLLVLWVAAVAWQALVIATLSPGSPHFYPGLLALPATLDWFAIGMALAVLSVAPPARLAVPLRVLDRVPSLAWLAAAGGFWALVHARRLFGAHGTVAWLAPHELRGLIAACVVAPAVFGHPRRGLVRRLLGARALLWVGTVSYGVYLWHLAVLIELRRAGAGAALGAGGFVALALAITLALAAISWYGLERHALAFGRRLSAARAAAPAGPASPPPAAADRASGSPQSP